MKTRHKKGPPRPVPGESYTLVDEMLASPSNPMPPADASERVRAAREHLAQIQTAPRPALMDWRVCAMVGNVIEIMLELGVVQDHQGLLPDAQEALKEASERALSTGAPIRLTGRGLTSVTWLIDSFEEILALVPHRTMIRAFRETDKRMRMLDRGQRRPGDYIARSFG